MSLENEVIQEVVADAPKVVEAVEVVAAIVPEVVDIVDKLAKFPIGDWEEARVEILKLRDKIAAYEATPATYGTPTDTAPTQAIETVTYPDGTQATGTAPLPSVSPTEENPALTAVIENLNSQISTLTAMHEEANSTVVELQEKCVDLETQLALAKNAPEEAIGNIEKHPAVTSLRAQVSSLRSEIMEKTVAHAKATSELSAMQVSKSAAEAEAESTNNANASLQARLDQAEKALADEKSRADKLQEQLAAAPAQPAPFTLKNIFFKGK